MLPKGKLLLFSCTLLSASAVGAQLPTVAQIKPEALSENSGIAKSLKHENVFWVINDSGDGPYLYAIDKWGRGLHLGHGIKVAGARNVDWESLTFDSQGHLIIGDCGNNANTRRDLTLYWVAEPDPAKDREAAVLRQVRFHYPEQVAFPPEKPDYDCEAIFWADGRLHLLTKHRSDLSTVLYRLDTLDEKRSTPATKVATFNTLGPVTGADCSGDGDRLAILTYTGVWVFERRGDNADWFSGAVSWAPLMAGQTEAICWIDESALLVTNEQRGIYKLAVSEFSKLRE